MYYLLYFILWFVTLLPLRVLYAVSDCLYPLVYHVFKYRRGVVRKNLVNSFPEKSNDEIITIEKKFYRYFCDLFIESFVQVHFSVSESLKRMTYSNPEVITDQFKKGKSVFLITSHYGNWEWNSSLTAVFPEGNSLYGIYKQLTNPTFDRLMIKIRTNFGGKVIETQDLFKSMLQMKSNNVQGAFFMLSDQRTPAHSARLWMTFMNQETAVLTGVEQLAKKFDYPIVFMNVERVKRGYYACSFSMIEESPKNCTNFEITEKYMNMLEEKIRKTPEYWLWTHNRWKHKRQTN